jgi:glycine cleavage system H protein
VNNMSENNFPDNLLYNRDYSWIKIEDETATLGVIKPAADKVKEFVFAKLPKKGEKLSRGDTYATLEALKWSGQLSTPLSGEVVEVNEKVFDQPSLINQDPYGKGWIAKIKLENPEEKKELLTADELKEGGE